MSFFPFCFKSKLIYFKTISETHLFYIFIFIFLTIHIFIFSVKFLLPLKLTKHDFGGMEVGFFLFHPKLESSFFFF